MNKILISIVAVLVLTIVSAVMWFFIFASKQPTPSPINPPVTLPSSGSTTYVPTTSGSTTSPGSSNTINTGTSNGGAVTTNDFIHNGVTLPDASNKGRYLLAGNLGYCISNPQECQAGSETDFNIFYESAYGSFTIALLNEPLGQTRLTMEQFLMNTLGIPQKDMCKLNYYVGTTYQVNALYSTKNLGFSFCPGATVLPK